MERKSIVNYKGARAYYDIKKDEKYFIATLEKYTGNSEEMPPRSVIFIKETGHYAHLPGRTCLDSNAANGIGASSLLDDISMVFSKF